MGNYHDYTRDAADRANEELRRRGDRAQLVGLSRQIEELESRITVMLTQLENITRRLEGNNG